MLFKFLKHLLNCPTYFLSRLFFRFPTLLLPLTFNYYYRLCSLIFNYIRIVPYLMMISYNAHNIFTLRLRVLLKIYVFRRYGVVFSLFSFFFFQNSNHERIWIVSPLLLSDITAPGYFYILPSSTYFFFTSRCFCSQFGIFPLYELELVQLQKYKILLGR